MKTLKEALAADPYWNFDFDTKNQFGDWFILIGQARDSGNIQLSNFAVCEKEIPENHILRTRCSITGWFDTMLIPPALKTKGLEIIERLENYPILNEEHYSELETESQNETRDWGEFREQIIKQLGLNCDEEELNNTLIKLIKANYDTDIEDWQYWNENYFDYEDMAKEWIEKNPEIVEALLDIYIKNL